MDRTFSYIFSAACGGCIALFLGAPAHLFAAEFNTSTSTSRARPSYGINAGDLVALTNADRAQHRLVALKVEPRLTLAAQGKASDMAARGYFAHASPDGRDAWYWFSVVGYDFDFAGENLAVYFSDSAAVERAWMNSSEHRANILNSAYTEVGIATAQGTYQGYKTTFVVEEFGTPRRSSRL